MFFDFINTIIKYFSHMLQSSLDLVSTIAKAHVYLLDVLLWLPEYFYVAIAPFIVLFILLMLLNRG